MEIEVSRRKFLQGSVALTILGGVSATNLFSDEGHSKEEKKDLSNVKFKKVPTLCEMCVNKCAAIARVEDGKVVKLDPNPAFPKSKNMLCPRGVAGVAALYDPDRLKSPMIRIGKRGEGKFKKVTWDEAYDAILNGTEDFKGLKSVLEKERDNRSTIGYCAGEGMAEHTYKTFISEKLGSPNFVNHSSICLQTVMAGFVSTIGSYGQPDLTNADYVIMAGANRAEAIVTPDTMDMFKRTKGRGAKLICIDPRFTNTAAKSDDWLAINVGTDLAFVLALTHVVLKEELYNKEFVKERFNGFKEYKAHIFRNNYTPEWAEEITGIKADKIRQVAREFMAAAPKAIYYQGRRTAWSKQDFQLRRAQAIFSALGGGIDTKGGIVFGSKLPLGMHRVNMPLYLNSQERLDRDAAKIVGDAGTWIGWRNKIIEGKSPYPVRVMFTYKQNPMLSVPNVAKTRKLFDMMDLVVTIDTMPSDTVVMSDVVLPESVYLEREDPVKSFGGIEPAIALRQKVVDEIYDTKPVFDIMKGLAEKLSKPLWEVTKKYDENVQQEIKKRGESAVYNQDGFNLTDMFEHSQEHINREMVVSKHGEEAWKTLREKGIYYPNMDKYFKQVNVNEFEYYPEDKKFYQVKKGKPFNTYTGKVECNLPYFSKKGIDAMPTWRENLYTKTPEGKFNFITGRHAQFTQNGTQNNAMLLDLIPENYLWINKRVAKEKGIKFGDLVEVSSKIGKVQIKAYPTEKIGPKNLFFIHGFGASSEALTLAYNKGASDNTIVEDVIEPVYGSAAMHETIVEIRKV